MNILQAKEAEMTTDKNTIMLRKLIKGTFLISQLKNVDASEAVGFCIHPRYEKGIVRLLSLFADDLISINGGDYETEIEILIDFESIDITIKKSYPFIYEPNAGPVESLLYTFGLADLGNDRSIHQAIDFAIKSHLEESTHSWLYQKPYSDVDKYQGFYKYVAFMDKMLFGHPELVHRVSYLQSIYEHENKKHIVGNIEANLNINADSPMLTIKLGFLYVSITNKGLLIRSTKSKDEKENPRKVFNEKEIRFEDVEQGVVIIYNQIYESSYTNTSDLLLVHDMMEI